MPFIWLQKGLLYAMFFMGMYIVFFIGMHLILHDRLEAWHDVCIATPNNSSDIE